MINEEVKMEEGNFGSENKKRKWSFLIISLLVVIAVGIGVYVGYKKLNNNNPVGVYKEAINKSYKSLTSNLKSAFKQNKDFDIMKEPLTVKLSTQVNSSLSELAPLNGVTLKGALSFDYAKERGTVSLGLAKNSDALNVMLALLNKNVYLESKEIYDKVIRFDEYDLFSDLNFNVSVDVDFDYDDLETILKEYKKILINSLDKDKFKTENVTIDIDGKSYKAEKITYIMDAENLKRTIKYICDSTSNNTKLLETLSKITDVSVDDIKDKLKDVDPDLDNFEEIDIDLYQDDKNNIIKVALSVYDEEVIVLTKTDFLKVSMDADDVVIKLEETKDYYDFTIDDGTDNMTLKYYKGNDKRLDFDFASGSDKIKANIICSNIVDKDKSFSADYEINLDMHVDGEDFDLSLKGNLAVELGNFEELNTSNSIYYKDLTEEELMDIYTKLSDSLTSLGFSEDLLEI